MGDLEEAKELYQAYEIVSGMTLDTYELKYRLAKAEGASYETLIEILEELKRMNIPKNGVTSLPDCMNCREDGKTVLQSVRI